jgi:hypothetical protein
VFPEPGVDTSALLDCGDSSPLLEQVEMIQRGGDESPHSRKEKRRFITPLE